ncbi:MAG TPA: permease-like cell division protein FtsX [Patescibacteria group bacterium]|jgi:cell division transport system permease protein
MSAVVTGPRIVRAALRSFYRNGWLSVAATAIVTFSLVLVSIFALLLLLGTNVIAAIQNKIDVEIFFKDDAKVADILTVKEQLERNPNAATVKYISKAEALGIYKGQSDRNKRLVEQISEEENPLPASIQVKAKNSDKLDAFSATLESDFAKPLVATRSDKENREIIQRLQRIVGFIRSMGLFVSLTVLTFAVLVVFNTIRIAIFSRREEIEIMRLVGASNAYIRGPFVLEGAFYGIIGTAIALLLVYLLVLAFGPAISSYLRELNEDVPAYFRANLPLILLIQLGTGIGVGVLSSYIAIRRHLRS